MMKIIKTICSSAAAKLMFGMAALMAVGSFSACTDIDENNRLIYVEPAKPAKHVLIEDFTGQLCVNCPKATNKIKELQETYGDDVIAVGIYGGNFGYNDVAKKDPCPLTTADGNSYYDTWNIKAQPSGMIDRASGVLSDLTFWAPYVNGLIKMEPTVAIFPTTDYDAATKNLKVNVEVAGLKTLEDAKLQVWLIEDGIVDYQLMTDGSRNDNYVHNHVFRATVSPLNGDPIEVKEGGDVKKSYSIQLKDEWKPENMSVVAFVFTNSGVQQTEKVSLLGK